MVPRHLLAEMGLGLTNAERQRRWRSRHITQALAHLRHLKIVHSTFKQQRVRTDGEHRNSSGVRSYCTPAPSIRPSPQHGIARSVRACVYNGDGPAHGACSPAPVSHSGQSRTPVYEIERVLGRRRNGNNETETLVKFRGWSGNWWLTDAELLRCLVPQSMSITPNSSTNWT
jgi:hypothetical protein